MPCKTFFLSAAILAVANGQCDTAMIDLGLGGYKHAVTILL